MSDPTPPQPNTPDGGEPSVIIIDNNLDNDPFKDPSNFDNFGGDKTDAASVIRGSTFGIDDFTQRTVPN
jgi:hypothetical protein